MPVPFIDLNPQFKSIEKEIISASSRVLRSQHFVLADEGRCLEAESAKYLGSKYALGLASGSDALYLALLALGIGAGDEVITSPFSFFATASSITRTGAKVVFADIDPDTFNLDPGKVRAKITHRTRAILPVHLFGLSCDMAAILKIAKKYSLRVVEDAAQSFGASYCGKKTGSLGDIGCFSFYPTKSLGGAGDGGMVSTDSSKLYAKIRLLRNHGSVKKYYHEVIGINSRLDELQAAILRIKLRRLDRWNAQRRRHAKVYDKAFKDLPLKIPVSTKDARSIYHLYTIRTPRRDALAVHLGRQGIGHGVYYPVPLHFQPCYKELRKRRGDYPVSESAALSVLSLPMYAELETKNIKAVIKSVRSFFGART